MARRWFTRRWFTRWWLAGALAALVVLAGCAPGGPTSLTVTGTVVDLFGNGVGGATVYLGSATKVSAADGSFTVDGVTAPYDVAVSMATPTPVVHVFKGLTKADPKLQALGPVAVSLSSMRQGTITGSLSAAVPAGSVAMVCTEGATQPVSDCARVLSGNTSYTLKPQWKTGSSASVTVHALVEQIDGDGYPTGYSAYGTNTGTVVNAASTAIDVTLGAAPGTTTLSGTESLPAGFTLKQLTVAVEVSPTLSLPVFDLASPPPAGFTSVPVPDFGGSTYSVYAEARPATGSADSSGWQQKIAGGTTVSLALPPAPTPVSPADGATGVGVGAEFKVAGSGGSPVTFTLVPASSSTAEPYVLITTDQQSVTVPDLAAYGVTLPAATSYVWGAYLTPTATTVEEAAAHWIGDETLARDTASGYPGSPVDAGSQAISDSPGFTTP